MSRINNAQLLRQEIDRLKALSREQEIMLTQQLKAVEESLQPHNLVRRAVSGLLASTAENRQFYTSLVSIGIDLALQRFTGRYAGNLAGNTDGSLLRKVLGNIAAKGYEALSEKLKGWFSRKEEQPGKEGVRMGSEEV
jgi:hypothetical protein